MVKAIKNDITACHENYQNKPRRLAMFESCAMGVLTV